MASSADLAHAIRSPSADEDALAAKRASSGRALRLSDAFDGRGRPPGRDRPLSAVDSESIIRYLDTGAQLNVLGHVRSSLPAVAAGIQGYIDFFGVIQVAPFPPLPFTIVRRGALLAPRRTHGMCWAHLENSGELLGLVAHRRTTAAQAGIDGLANAASNRTYFAHILHMGDFARFLRFGSCNTKFSRVAYLSFLLPLRLQSEDSSLFRA